MRTSLPQERSAKAIPSGENVTPIAAARLERTAPLVYYNTQGWSFVPGSDRYDWSAVLMLTKPIKHKQGRLYA